MKVKSESEVAQSCPTLSMDCSPPGSSVPGIFQVRVLEWGAVMENRHAWSGEEHNRVPLSKSSCSPPLPRQYLVTHSNTYIQLYIYIYIWISVCHDFKIVIREHFSLPQMIKQRKSKWRWNINFRVHNSGDHTLTHMEYFFIAKPLPTPAAIIVNKQNSLGFTWIHSHFPKLTDCICSIR